MKNGKILKEVEDELREWFRVSDDWHENNAGFTEVLALIEYYRNFHKKKED